MSATPSLGLLRLPRAVLFGAGQRYAVGPAVAGLGRTALVCTDSRLAASEELAAIVRAIEETGVTVHVFGDTQPELPVDGVLACVAGLTGLEIDVVVGVGGGSCLDMAKVVALLLAHGGRPQDYYGENVVPGPTLPVAPTKRRRPFRGRRRRQASCSRNRPRCRRRPARCRVTS